MELALPHVFFSFSHHRDFAPYKPFYIASDNLGDYQFFFSTGEKKSGCFLAPERFVDSKAIDELKKKVTPEDIRAMDVFSLGCIIAEVYIGHPLFDLPRLQAYKKDPGDSKNLLDEIKDSEAKSLLFDMLQKDPKKRKTINEYLRLWCEKVFPGAFTMFYYNFVASLLNSPFSGSDKKIAQVFKYLDAIWAVSFNKKEPYIPVSINNVLFEDLREENIETRTDNGIVPCFKDFCLDSEGENRIILWDIIKANQSVKAR